MPLQNGLSPAIPKWKDKADLHEVFAPDRPLASVEENITDATQMVNRDSSPSDLKITDLRIAEITGAPMRVGQMRGRSLSPESRCFAFQNRDEQHQSGSIRHSVSARGRLQNRPFSHLQSQRMSSFLGLVTKVLPPVPRCLPGLIGA